MGRKKRPGPNAEQRKLASEWDAIKAAAARPLEKGAKSKGLESLPVKKRQAMVSQPHVTGYERVAPVQKASSKGTGVGNATKSKDKVYTGDKMLGVATMHKSNSVPVFQAEDAIDIAKMRR